MFVGLTNLFMFSQVILVAYGCFTDVSEAERTVVLPDGSVNGAGSVNGYHSDVVPGRNVAEVNEFCKVLGGKRPIHSILVATNGMAAVKFIRSVRTWAYETFGSEKAVKLVAMATPEDMRINAEHIRIADQFVEVPGGTNNNNYANVQLIVEVISATFWKILMFCYSSFIYVYK